MRIYTDEKERLLAIWLSAEESDDEAVMALLPFSSEKKVEEKL